jgi:hypothetical protein
MSLGSLAYGVVSAALLLAAMTRYLLPTRYELDDREAAWRQLVWHRRSWTSFRRVDRHSDGLFLSPFRRPNRLDAFRGVFLRFGPSVDGSAVADLVESRVSL